MYHLLIHNTHLVLRLAFAPCTEENTTTLWINHIARLELFFRIILAVSTSSLGHALDTPLPYHFVWFILFSWRIFVSISLSLPLFPIVMGYPLVDATLISLFFPNVYFLAGPR